MKSKLRSLTPFFLFLLLLSFKMDVEPLEKMITENLDFAVQQSIIMANSLKGQKDKLPKTTDQYGNLETCNSGWWVSGFFPGQLWYLYEYSKNEEVKKRAVEFTNRVEKEQYNTSTHDVGFMIFCSFGNGYRITHDSLYRKVIYNAAKSLSTRFNEKTGCLRSWDYASWNMQWQYPVIIDNMMNLELLLWAAKEFNEPKLKEIAVSHANKTMKNHYRPDFSCYHVVSYDTITGIPEKKNTAQGYNHESSWARGQAWGLYGFAMMFRYTKDSIYLNHAINIANFIINHLNLPEDKIPYWDFNAPDIPDCYRDASAAAIMCSALIELSNYVNFKLADKYLSVAETQIRTLSSSQYRSTLGNNGNFLLKHSVGHKPNNTEVDVPLTYADYYFIEALMRLKKLKGF